MCSSSAADTLGSQFLQLRSATPSVAFRGSVGRSNAVPGARIRGFSDDARLLLDCDWSHAPRPPWAAPPMAQTRVVESVGWRCAADLGERRTYGERFPPEPRPVDSALACGPAPRVQP